MCELLLLSPVAAVEELNPNKQCVQLMNNVKWHNKLSSLKQDEYTFA